MVQECSKAFVQAKLHTTQGFTMESVMTVGQQEGLPGLTWVANKSKEATELMAWHHKIQRHAGGVPCDVWPVRPLPLCMLR